MGEERRGGASGTSLKRRGADVQSHGVSSFGTQGVNMLCPCAFVTSKT